MGRDMRLKRIYKAVAAGQEELEKKGHQGNVSTYVSLVAYIKNRWWNGV